MVKTIPYVGTALPGGSKGEPLFPLGLRASAKLFSGALRASVTAGKKDKNTSGRGIHFPDRTPLPAPLTQGGSKGGTAVPPGLRASAKLFFRRVARQCDRRKKR